MGAELERLRWGAGIAREAGPTSLTIGAYVNVAVHPEREMARELVGGGIATFARFATHGAPADGLSEVTKRPHLARFRSPRLVSDIEDRDGARLQRMIGPSVCREGPAAGTSCRARHT